MRVEVNKHIVIDSEICHGKPTFSGTRVMVYLVLEMLEAGCSIKDIIRAYPSLTKSRIRAALQYAADITRGEDNVVVRVGA